MNNNYNNDMYREPSYIPTQSTLPPYTNFPGYQKPPISKDVYAENILEKNIGKMASFYMAYPDSIQWRDKIFTGIIQAAGRDYVLLIDPSTSKSNLLWTIYLNYVIWDEKAKA